MRTLGVCVTVLGAVLFVLGIFTLYLPSLLLGFGLFQAGRYCVYVTLDTDRKFKLFWF